MSKNLILFDPRDQKITAQQARRYALFEIGHTIVDFAAAFLFVIGSILFFFEEAMIPGTWCFLVGSIFFAAKPSIRLAREIWLAKLKNIDRLAEKAPEGPGGFQKLTGDDDASRGNGHSPAAEPTEGQNSSGQFRRSQTG